MERLSRRVSTLRMSENYYLELENLLSIRKKELGIRGENFNILDLIREAIAFYVKYKKGDFIGDPSKLESALNQIIDMKDEIGELSSFVKFLKNQTTSSSDKKRIRR